jgi:hypothetical protein
VTNKKSVIFFLIFVAGLAAAIPVRVGLILHNIDAAGYYKNSHSSAVTCFNITLLAAAVLLIIPFFIKSFRRRTAKPGKSYATGVLSAVLAVCFCLDALYRLYGLLFNKALLKADGASLFIIALFEIAAAVFFVLYSSITFKGVKTALPYASLTPVIWGVVNLMVIFMHYATDNTSENLDDMLKVLFVMLFFYYHARYTGWVARDGEYKGMLAFGLPAVFFCLVSVLPRYIALAFGAGVTLNPTYDLLSFALAVYIFYVLARLSFGRQPAAEKDITAPAAPEA